ncbi:Phosphoglucomutase @ Phosphomannomutase [hydrothermal vent metagenome]|uniref:Phosphoglucomutase @ Phosphomannomutase n=1 Tax=hydrothermal vent metagenome TaxID=652676 RepID=A0A3B0ZHL1_9ZZZZ
MNTHPPASIFKAYDIRGIVGKELTEEGIRLIGCALGSEACARGESHFYCGRDGRLSSYQFHQALIRGLLSTGCHVTDLGCVPTPVAGFAALALGEGNMAMITASHNPPNYNGVKMMLGGESLSGEEIQLLYQRIVQQDFCEGDGQCQPQDVLPDYFSAILKCIKLSRPLRVVVDCGNGVAGIIAPKLLKLLGCQVIELFCDIDGRFPHHHPNPSDPQNLVTLIAAVIDNQADLGFAFDGDGDRLGVIAPDGRIIWADLQMILFAEDILSRQPNANIVFDIKSTRHLARRIDAAGGHPILCASGYTLIKAKMKACRAALAGEMSGHIFFSDSWYGLDDACFSAARLLAIVAAHEAGSQALFDGLPRPSVTPELYLGMPEGDASIFVEQLKKVSHFTDASRITIDGLRLEFTNGWGLVRASNTTPSLVFRFEGVNEVALKQIQRRFHDLILSQDPTLVLPF